MFFLNTYRWDFPQVAALIAPRPLLIGNSDKDKLFPLDGVVRLYNETRRIYQLTAGPRLGLTYRRSPQDTQELRVPVFHWFNRFLKGQDPLIEMAARDFFPAEQLRVFNKLPKDKVNTKIDETPCPRPLRPSRQAIGGIPRGLARQSVRRLAGRVPPAKPGLSGQATQGDVRLRTYSFNSQPDVTLLFRVQRPEGEAARGGPFDSARRRKLDEFTVRSCGWKAESSRGIAGECSPEDGAGVRRAARRGAKQVVEQSEEGDPYSPPLHAVGPDP